PHVLRGERAVPVVACGEADDQLCIAKDRDVRVVRGENKLPPPLLLTHLRHDALGDEPVVEVVLGLVNHQRRVGLEKQQELYGRGLLVRREVVESLPDGILTLGRRVELDGGRGRQVEFFDFHPHGLRSLRQLLGLRRQQAVLSNESVLAGTTSGGELAQRKLIEGAQGLQRFEQAPTHLPSSSTTW